MLFEMGPERDERRGIRIGHWYSRGANRLD